MNATRTRLVSLGLVKPHTIRNREASKAKAIGSRRQEMRRSVAVTTTKVYQHSTGR